MRCVTTLLVLALPTANGWARSLSLLRSTTRVAGGRVLRSVARDNPGNATKTLADQIGAKLTGDEGYRFGDLTKKAVTDFTGKDAYEMGDVSREIDKRVKRQVSEITGKADYQFGDLTAAAMINVNKTMQGFVAMEFPQLFDALTENQRIALASGIARVLAVAMLSYSLVANIGASLALALAWFSCARATGASPLVAGGWVRLAATRSALAAVFEPLALPLRCGIAVLATPKYADLVAAIEARLPRASDETEAPVPLDQDSDGRVSGSELRRAVVSRPQELRRALAILLAFFGVNILGAGLCAGLGVFAASMAARVPIFPR